MVFTFLSNTFSPQSATIKNPTDKVQDHRGSNPRLLGENCYFFHLRCAFTLPPPKKKDQSSTAHVVSWKPSKIPFLRNWRCCSSNKCLFFSTLRIRTFSDSFTAFLCKYYFDPTWTLMLQKWMRYFEGNISENLRGKNTSTWLDSNPPSLKRIEYSPPLLTRWVNQVKCKDEKYPQCLEPLNYHWKMHDFYSKRGNLWTWNCFSDFEFDIIWKKICRMSGELQMSITFFKDLWKLHLKYLWEKFKTFKYHKCQSGAKINSEVIT